MGNRAALLRAITERGDLGEGELSNRAADRFQFSLGERAMDLSVFQAARSKQDLCGLGCDDADQSVRDASGIGVGSDGAGERNSKEVSEVRSVLGAHAFQQLFHDHDLSNAVALPGVQLDVGSIDSDCAVCVAGVAATAFWTNAAAESVKRWILDCTGETEDLSSSVCFC
jgi:hypothetical protein